MCDVLNLDVQPPTRMLELAIPAINEFVRSPSEWSRFEQLDWMMTTLFAKWFAYSSARRISACRGGAECDEVLDLLG